jgi:hypothetical protein
MKLMDAHGISCSRLELKKCSGISCNAKGVLNLISAARTRNGMNTRIEGLTEIQRHRAEMS